MMFVLQKNKEGTLYLTLTRVVFEQNTFTEMLEVATDLTLTRVVFE